MERFCDFVGGDRNKIVSYNDRNVVYYYVYSKDMKEDLAKNNILPDKTHKKEFPIIDDKNNWENDEFNRDGHNNNHSKDWLDYDTKKRKMELALVINILCTPYSMILGGDEFGRTQNGNNNSYKKLYPLGLGVRCIS